MVDSDARPLVTQAMGLRERLGDIGRFAARPTYPAPPLGWGHAAAPGLVVALGIVFAFDLALGELIVMATNAWDAGAGFMPAPLEIEATLAEDLFDFLILAPLLEELVFRGWLTGRIAALRFALYGFAAMGLFSAALYLPVEYVTAVSLTGVAVAFAGLLHWSVTRDTGTEVPAWFTGHFHWFVWGSSLAFGLIHLGNYEPLAHPLGLLVVLPQTIGGLLLAYTRTRLGLGAAIAHHAAYNAVFLASDYGVW